MPRSPLVGALILSLFLSSCATPQRFTPTADGPAVCSGWDPPPQESSHPIRNWCQDHPIITVAGITLLVAGGIFVAGSAILAAEFAQMH